MKEGTWSSMGIAWRRQILDQNAAGTALPIGKVEATQLLETMAQSHKRMTRPNMLQTLRPSGMPFAFAPPCRYQPEKCPSLQLTPRELQDSGRIRKSDFTRNKDERDIVRRKARVSVVSRRPSSED